MSSTENSRWSTSLCLLNEVRNGHTEGWQKFLHLYTPLLMAWCRKAKLQDADTSDVCQEVFQAVMAGIGRVKCGPGYSFRGWLWTITQRSLARHFQEQQASPRVHGGTDAQRRMNVIPDWVDNDSAPESEAADAEVIRRAAEIIRADFEERTWQAFWMSTVENVPPAEIAAELGMTTNSIRQARFRVLARLREFVGSGDERQSSLSRPFEPSMELRVDSSMARRGKTARSWFDNRDGNRNDSSPRGIPELLAIIFRVM